MNQGAMEIFREVFMTGARAVALPSSLGIFFMLNM
jgi:hypothetical protein